MKGLRPSKSFNNSIKPYSFSSPSRYAPVNKLNLPRKFSTNTFTAPQHLKNVPPTKITTLKNGVRVATEDSYGETATVGVFIDAGSVYEDDRTNGVAHFLEHMAFKGTNNRTKVQLEQEIENMGGVLNAYTSREQTVYYTKVLKNDVPKSMDILSDILLHSKLEEKYIDSERSTILREMEEVNKDHSEVIFDNLHAAAFQGTPLGRTILGPEANIKTINRSDLSTYIKENYQPQRIVIAAAGGIQHDELVSLTDRYFGKLESSPTSTQKPALKYTGSGTYHRDDSIPEAHVALAVEGRSWSHPDYFTVMVVQTIIGAWERNIGGGKNLSSRLCETVATKGLCHSITAFNTCYSNTGLFGTYFVAEPQHLEDLCITVSNEFHRIGNYVTPGEVERAKTKLMAGVLMQLDGTTAIAEDIGRQILNYGKRLSPAEIYARINSITQKDVMRVAVEMFEDADPVISAYGNIELLPDYTWIRDMTSWPLI